MCRILDHCWAVFLKKTWWLWCQNSSCDWKSFFKVDFAWRESRERWSKMVPVIFLEFIFRWKPTFVDDMELCHCFYKFVNKFQYGKEFFISGFHVFYCFFVCDFFSMTFKNKPLQFSEQKLNWYSIISFNVTCCMILMNTIDVLLKQHVSCICENFIWLQKCAFMTFFLMKLTSLETIGKIKQINCYISSGIRLHIAFVYVHGFEVFFLYLLIFMLLVSLLLCKHRIGQYHMFNVYLSHLCTCITLHIEHLYNYMYTCKYMYVHVIPDKLF